VNLTLVTETFPPEINGVSMTLGRLVDGLAARGIRMTVIAPERRERRNGQDSHHLVMVPGLPIPRYPELRFGLPAGHRLSDLWHEAPPDLVHVATEGPLGWSALRTARQLGIPVVSSFHTNFHTYGQHYGYGFLKSMVLSWMRTLHNQTALTFAPSEDLIRELEQDGFRNLRLLPRGIDTNLFGPHRRDPALRQTWGAGDNTPVAIHVGRVAKEKNLDLVVRAYLRMRGFLPGLRLVLVGDGPDLKRIKAAHPEIHCAGMQRGTSLAAHYASADCFLFASITETFGNVVTEAMASALPVLAYDYAAPARFISDGINGMLAPFNDESAFLDAASQLALDFDNWPAMGVAARRRVSPHSWERIVDGYLSEIASVVPLFNRQTS
jgi:glycosyltransferase involved in cell wall biosynthesis